MKEKILIVEDEFIVANDLQMILEKDGYTVVGIADSMKQAVAILDVVKPDLVLLDIYLKGKLTGIDIAKRLMHSGIPFIYVSANSNERIFEAAKSTQPYGFIVKPYRNNDILLSIDIARYRAQHSANLKLSGELYMRGAIEGIFKSELTADLKLIRTMSAFQPYVPFDFVKVTGLDHLNGIFLEVNISRRNFEDYELIPREQIVLKKGLNDRAVHHEQHVDALNTDAIYTGETLAAVAAASPEKEMIMKQNAFRSNLEKTLQLHENRQLKLSFWSKLPDIYSQDHLDLLHHLSGTLAAYFPNIVGTSGTYHSKSENMPDFGFKKDDNVTFEGIVGSSTALLQVLDQVKIVARTDTSVLITGESGTGKELIAANLHRLSDRKLKPMVTINCAALPGDLIESILFGHEKGSFTGASERRAGKFEEADGGTVFLDEIGEMPVELQSKLLRVLQEKEIERIGGTNPIKIDLRIIAATNRDLEREVANGRFRLDLYYRLAVFPIHLPPLRERRADIRELAAYFIAYHAKKLKKEVLSVSPQVLDELLRYDWPGNVRELEHLIERSVLMAPGNCIEENYLGVEIAPATDPVNGKSSGFKTIAENEKEYIIEVLKKCSGRIAGEGGAAELLGIPPTTLNSKIKKLGIRR